MTETALADALASLGSHESPEIVPFPKFERIPRLRRDITITDKREMLLLQQQRNAIMVPYIIACGSKDDKIEIVGIMVPKHTDIMEETREARRLAAGKCIRTPTNFPLTRSITASGDSFGPYNYLSTGVQKL